MEIDCEVAVVGAGVAGLSCAQSLSQAGRDVRVVEKSRGVGGRVATRRLDEMSFDHGAPWLEASGTAAFCDWVAACRTAGLLTSWVPAGSASLVAAPGMNAFAKPLAEQLAISLRSHVEHLDRETGHWRLRIAEQGTLSAKTVVLAVPAPQARQLLSRTGWEAGLSDVRMAPCWTVMAAFGEPLPVSALQIGPHGPLGLAINNSAKPNRPPGEQWVLHATPKWSEDHIEMDREMVGERLLESFSSAICCPLPAPQQIMIHRWRYARTTRALGRPCAWSPERQIGLAGDWCLGNQIGDAWESGQALARHILGN